MQYCTENDANAGSTESRAEVGIPASACHRYALMTLLALFVTCTLRAIGPTA